MPESDTQLNGYYFEELSTGMTDIFGKTITDADISLFAGISCDTNPLHLNDAYAKNTVFGDRIAHGMLTASLISTVIGTKLPGAGSIYISQSLQFKSPVRIGDTVIARCSITKLIPKGFLVKINTQCLVDKIIVVDGEAIVKVPSKQKA